MNSVKNNINPMLVSFEETSDSREGLSLSPSPNSAEAFLSSIPQKLEKEKQKFQCSEETVVYSQNLHMSLPIRWVTAMPWEGGFVEGTMAHGVFFDGRAENIRLKDGSKFTGTFRQNKPYTGMVTGDHIDGVVYEGQYKKGLFNFNGASFFKNGKRFTGKLEENYTTETKIKCILVERFVKGQRFHSYVERVDKPSRKIPGHEAANRLKKKVIKEQTFSNGEVTEKRTQMLVFERWIETLTTEYSNGFRVRESRRSFFV